LFARVDPAAGQAARGQRGPACGPAPRRRGGHAMTTWIGWAQDPVRGWVKVAAVPGERFRCTRALTIWRTSDVRRAGAATRVLPLGWHPAAPDPQDGAGRTFAFPLDVLAGVRDFRGQGLAENVVDELRGSLFRPGRGEPHGLDFQLGHSASSLAASRCT